MWDLLASPVRMSMGTSATLLRTSSWLAAGVATTSAFPNMSGATMVYHSFSFHLSLTLLTLGMLPA